MYTTGYSSERNIMKTNDKLVLTKEQLVENPAVNPGIVKEALKMRLELERLGVWDNSGTRVVSPSEIRPAKNPIGNIRRRSISQIR